MDTRPTDQRAWEARQSGMTWAQIARDLHYANGSVARRAAMRHEARLDERVRQAVALPPEVAHRELDAISSGRDEGAINDALQQIGRILTQPHIVELVNEPTDGPITTPDLTRGDVVYHRAMPKAKFEFVKWNADGSVQVWGGERGYAAYRDFRIADISRHPSGADEALLAWAAANLHVETTVEALADLLEMAPAAVRRVVAARPDVFRRVRRGVYETRNPQADRAADKAGAA